MYYIYLKINGEWVEHAKYERREECVNCLKAIGHEKVRIVGPFGTWDKSLIRKNLVK